jgi:hypothetical protein
VKHNGLKNRVIDQPAKTWLDPTTTISHICGRVHKKRNSSSSELSGRGYLRTKPLKNGEAGIFEGESRNEEVVQQIMEKNSL